LVTEIAVLTMTSIGDLAQCEAVPPEFLNVIRVTWNMKKILLVNNQEAFLDRNKSLLNRAGFLILTATSAEEALRICREETLDLIIARLDLPETGGDQLCSLIRQDSDIRNVAVILVCYGTEAELKRTSECGANAVVTKPIRPEFLLEQISKFLKIPARRDYRAIFNAEVNGTRENMSFTGMTRNISVSGILCETTIHLNQDDLLTNLLLAIDSHQIVADGKVVRSISMPDGSYNYGVQFTSIAPEFRERIEQFVAAPEQRQVRGEDGMLSYLVAAP
jgi:CheY-like chemotaxis protein